jgi:hypothetical protein
MSFFITGISYKNPVIYERDIYAIVAGTDITTSESKANHYCASKSKASHSCASGSKAGHYCSSGPQANKERAPRFLLPKAKEIARANIRIVVLKINGPLKTLFRIFIRRCTTLTT